LGGTGKIAVNVTQLWEETLLWVQVRSFLGNLQIGDRVRIGSVVLRDVPALALWWEFPVEISNMQDIRLSPLEHGKLPDVEASAIRSPDFSD
jgi:serine O-acetyltransferase